MPKVPSAQPCVSSSSPGATMPTCPWPLSLSHWEALEAAERTQSWLSVMSQSRVDMAPDGEDGSGWGD